GLRRQHLQRVVRQFVTAVVGLTRPDRQYDVAGHAEFAADARQCVVVLRGELLAARGETLEGRLAQVLRRRLYELRLLRRLLRPARNGEIGQRQIGMQAGDRFVEGRARDAELLSRRPLFGQPAVESGIGARRDARRQQQKRDKREEKSSLGHAAPCAVALWSNRDQPKETNGRRN